MRQKRVSCRRLSRASRNSCCCSRCTSTRHRPRSLLNVRLSVSRSISPKSWANSIPLFVRYFLLFFSIHQNQNWFCFFVIFSTWNRIKILCKCWQLPLNLTTKTCATLLLSLYRSVSFLFVSFCFEKLIETKTKNKKQ